MLNMSTDCYSIWNYRREIIENMKRQINDDNRSEALPKFQELCDNELRWLEGLMPMHPKSYWVWLHRKHMCLVHPNLNWKTELALCTKALDLDSRNFHCWNYRRWVASESNVKVQDELAYTMKKVEQNFSNYSAWHQRSYLLPKLFEDNPDGFITALTEELEMVQNAFYTAPEDQSSWFYHRWLVGMCKQHLLSDHYSQVVSSELDKVNELLQEDPEAKWPLLTSVFLMVELGSSHERSTSILPTLHKLIQNDPKHAQYYKDYANSKSIVL
jgi:geranylgeranyl transferase type-2 subunit alpha